MINVVKAVWMAKYLLISTILLILIVIYFFAVFSVLVLKSDYDKTLSGSCENVWFCLVTIFDSWYKADGTIGGWLDEEAPSLSSGDEYNTDSVRILSDFIFNFIVGILLIEIFSGILTDSFAKIRSEHEELSSIQETRCFVCDKERKKFSNFKHHTQYEHNLWNYIIYMFTLIYSKDDKYQKFLRGEIKGSYWIGEKKMGYCGEIYFKKREVDVRGPDYIEAIISNRLRPENSDDYVRAFLAHYEIAKEGKFKPFGIDQYLSWLPYTLTQREEHPRLVREIFKNEVNEIFEKKVNRLEKKVDEKMNEMKEMMAKILDILEKK
jgi:hypothetical protein